MAFNEQMLLVILSVIIGTLAAIVYSLRILVVMDRRIERIEEHIERVATRMIKEELKIERAVLKKKPKRRKK